MPDIMEQLEEGKKLQEQGIDIDSLRTKLNSSEEEKTTEKQEQTKEEKQEEIKDPFEQAEDMLNKSENSEEKPVQQKESKPEKYPGFNFHDNYQVGQKIYYVKAQPELGVKELLELKIRSIYPKTIVACKENKCTQCIGPDTHDMIFTDERSAMKAYNNVKVRTYKTSSKNDSEDIVNDDNTEEDYE